MLAAGTWGSVKAKLDAKKEAGAGACMLQQQAKHVARVRAAAMGATEGEAEAAQVADAYGRENAKKGIGAEGSPGALLEASRRNSAPTKAEGGADGRVLS